MTRILLSLILMLLPLLSAPLTVRAQTRHLILFCAGATFALRAQSIQPSDPEATPEARQRLERLDKIRQKGIMYGHQDDLLRALKADPHYLFYEDIKDIR